MPAFLAAAEAGLGVELDVRPSADHVPIVFHDADLERTTGHAGSVADFTAAALSGLRLRDNSPLPRLQDVLACWPLHLPILCEIKIDAGCHTPNFLDAVATQLMDFEGLAAAMSFDPDTVAALPEPLQRGQVIPPREESGDSAFQALISRSQGDHCDYLACHHGDADMPALQARRPDMPLLVWTVTEARQASALSRICDGILFEGFSAAEATSLYAGRA